MNEEQIRAEFETWALDTARKHNYTHISSLFARRDDGSYKTSWVDTAFLAWQAALASQAKSVPYGWKLVPIELSHKQKQDMVWAYEEAMGGGRLPDGDGYDFEIVQKMHEAMLASTPQVPTNDDRVRELPAYGIIE